MSDIDTDVLVVGAGPAGLSAAALLAAYGVDAITITKYPGTANSPRAHITNQRTMEVFRDLGLEEAVREVRGAEQRGADIRFSTELITISQDAETARAVVRERDTGREYTIRARYVIGSDGGRSTVAEQLGFAFDGESGLGCAVNVWLEVDLTRYTAHRPGTLYWMCQPGNDYWVGSGTFICVQPWTEWVMLFMYDPAQGEPDLSESSMAERAQTLIGDPEVDVRVKAVSEWQINHLVAREYRKGRVFLAGDAAHRHPPANGLGTNTSIQDSFNLAWKLAHVLRGQASDALLDTYHDERRAVGKQVVDRAMKSVTDMLSMSQAFGFRPGQNADEGRAAIEELFSDSPRGRTRRSELEEAVALQNYQFNAHGVELGQRYDSPAIVDDATPWPEYQADPELYYQPTTHPGAHVPHAWLQHGQQPVSTVDLVGQGRFTAIAGTGGCAWLDAADKIGAELGVNVAGKQVGLGCEYDDVLFEWSDRREIADGGCLLVRPDRHIAWRSTDAAEDPVTALRGAFQQVLAVSA